jgi:hypothetical protein
MYPSWTKFVIFSLLFLEIHQLKVQSETLIIWQMTKIVLARNDIA